MDFYDIEEKEQKYKELPPEAKETQNVWITTLERAEYLKEHNAVEIIEEIKEEIVEKQTKKKKTSKK